MEKVILFDVIAILFFGMIWLCIALFLRIWKKVSHVYLVFSTLFFVYALKVLDYTLFQFQSLLIFRYFMPELMLRGQTADKVINLIPLVTLTSGDLNTSSLNILLFIPFGFGLPFITDFRMKRVVVSGVVCSIAIELLQLITGYVARVTFRIADINDVIFNTVGVALGYVFFICFVRACR